MESIRNTFRNIINPRQTIPPGVYHYQSPQDDPRNYRLHLRVESDGSGILIVNASTVLHLNRTATEYAYHLVQNHPVEEAAQAVVKRYQVGREEARRDYTDFIERINTLINTPDLDPVTFLGFERQPPFTGQITAPYRLDCAITYKLPVEEAPDSAPTDRVERELSTEEWKTVLDKAWQAGIPHIVFTGGEPSLRDDLPELIAHAESNNQVTGLLSEGLRLYDREYLQALLQTGLDHLMLILQPDNEQDWQALHRALDEDLFVAVHLTLDETNQKEIRNLLDRLAEMDVRAVSLSASSPELQTDLQDAYEYATMLNMELVWNLPVPYSANNPVGLEVQHGESPEGAGEAFLYVEPDGDVLPAQGVNRVLGNLLEDPWEKIWSARHG